MAYDQLDYEVTFHLIVQRVTVHEITECQTIEVNPSQYSSGKVFMRVFSYERKGRPWEQFPTFLLIEKSQLITVIQQLPILVSYFALLVFRFVRFLLAFSVTGGLTYLMHPALATSATTSKPMNVEITIRLFTL
jgi:hypothetical protein